MIQIDSNFPSGNIEVVAADDPANIRLRIRPDPVTNFLQWFHFRVVGAKDRDLVLRIENANDALVRKGWEGYRAFASLDSTRSASEATKANAYWVKPPETASASLRLPGT